MKKNNLLKMIFLIILVLSLNYYGVKAYDFTASGSGSYSKPGGCGKWRGCWYNSSDMGYRFTFVDSSGNQLAGTKKVDYFSSSTAVNRNNIDSLIKNYKAEIAAGKTNAANGQKNYYYNGSNTFTNRIELTDYGYNAKAYSSEETLSTLTKIINTLLVDSNVEQIYPNKGSLKNTYIVVEPIYLIGYDGYYYLGTAYDMALNIQYNRNQNKVLTGLENAFLYNIASNMHLTENIIGYTGVNVSNWLDDNGQIPNDGSIRKKYTSSVANAKNGYGKHVVSIESVLDIQEEKNCPIVVDINECGESTITETTDSTCVVGNDLYLYMSECNLYCTDKIETNFSDFYKTFIGNNKFQAIISGKYISVKSYPKITIIKTCYQSAPSNECPNWTASLENKIKKDYKTHNVTLNVDGFINNGSITGGNTYTLIGVPGHKVNDSRATITYEYRLDENTNKFIDMESMKGIYNANLNNLKKIIEMDGPSIITTVSQGLSNYFLDFGSTALNKYSDSSTRLTEVKVTSNSNYIFKNSYTIKYIDSNKLTKNKYTSSGNDDSNDLNFACSFNKSAYCICPENRVCDPITCDSVKNPPCECNSECGCKDNKTCDPIPCHIEEIEVCNPEIETCFPNVVYRPISLTNPFPGIDGSNIRNPGNNWNGVARDENGNLIYYNGSILSLSDYYIRYNRGYNDYEIYQTKPLYTIRLDADTINYIRDYNDAVRKKSNSDYNDFDFTCENGEKCISNFLRGTSKIAGYNRNLLDSERSECYRSNSFDSCIARKGA